MPIEHTYWHAWVNSFKRWGISSFMASIIDSTSPLSICLSQILVTVSPFVARSESFQSFASMLENPAEAHAFADLLREEPIQ